VISKDVGFILAAALVLVAILIPYVLYTTAFGLAFRKGFKARASAKSKLDKELERLALELKKTEERLSGPK
jgi:hypothetical protein